MKTIEINAKLQTLEDFHIGSGVGMIGLFDDGQVKDINGIPQINSTTLKGLLRDSCEDLMLVGYRNFSSELFSQVFELHDNLNSIDVFVSSDYCSVTENSTHIHFFTKISDETGTAQKGSLRSIECGTKGMQFCVKIRYSISDEIAEQTKDFLACGLNNIKAIGGHRRRGFGAVKVFDLHSRIVDNAASSSVEIKTSNLELRITLEADTLFSARAQMGNLLQTNDHIPGSTILGLLRAVQISHGFMGKYLDDCNCTVSSFYPLPKCSDRIDLMVIPAPMSMRKRKSSLGKTDDQGDLPVWALSPKTEGRFGQPIKSILISNSMHEEREAKDPSKGLYDGYFYTAVNDDQWLEAQYYKPSTRLQQRNAIQRVTQSTQDNGVFLEEKIEIGTVFKGTICFNTPNHASEFVRDLDPWLSGIAGIHLGKGGMPAKITYSETKPVKENGIALKNGCFSITLLSDSILMDDLLFPIRDISNNALEQLLGNTFPESDFILLQKASRNGITSSFSGLSGLRRFRDVTIKKGSCYLFKYKGTDHEKLADVLGDLHKSGIGFRKNEGFGVISINHPIHQIELQETHQNHEYKVATALINSEYSKELTRRACNHIQAKDITKKLKELTIDGHYWKGVLSGILFKLEGKTPLNKVTDALDAKMKDGWKKDDCRYKLAEYIMGLMEVSANLPSLSIALKHVLHKEAK